MDKDTRAKRTDEFGELLREVMSEKERGQTAPAAPNRPSLAESWRDVNKTQAASWFLPRILIVILILLVSAPISARVIGRGWAWPLVAGVCVVSYLLYDWFFGNGEKTARCFTCKRWFTMKYDGTSQGGPYGRNQIDVERYRCQNCGLFVTIERTMHDDDNSRNW